MVCGKPFESLNDKFVMSNQSSGNGIASAELSKPLSSKITFIWRCILGLFLAFLLFRAWQVRNTPFEQIDWAFKGSRELVAWFSGLVLRELRVVGFAFVLGLLTPPAFFGPTTAIEDQKKRWLVRLLWLLFGLAVIGICFTIAWDEMPPLGSLILPFISFAIAIRLSSAALRGMKPFIWAAAQIVIALLVMVGATIAVGDMTVSDAPLEFDTTEMSTAEKQLLAQRIQDTRPLEGQLRKLHLADAEINALTNSVINRGNIQHLASIHFEPGTFEARASLALPQLEAKKFLNIRMDGHLAIDEGELDLGIERLRVGRFTVPGPLVRLLSSTLHTMFMEDPQIRRITDSVEKLHTEQGAVNFEFQSDAISRQIVPSLVQLLWKQPDVAHETGLYVRQIVSAFDMLPADDNRFGKLVQNVFALAVERSKDHDPVLENRAAIFGLAMVLGHADLEPFVGEVFDADLRTKTSKMLNQVTLRGRQDLPRHFLVSAALALMASEAISDRIGVMKEQIDSQQGGSGFSFVDMLANMSGIRLAMAAIRDADTARAVQAKLARGFEVDAIFPKFEGLPEDIPAAEFQSKYGGVNGPGYKVQIEEINRRLETLPKF